MLLAFATRTTPMKLARRVQLKLGENLTADFGSRLTQMIGDAESLIENLSSGFAALSLAIRSCSAVFCPRNPRQKSAVSRTTPPPHFVLVEIYRAQEATVAHKATAHYATWRDTATPMMAQPRIAVKYSYVFDTDTALGRAE